MAKSAAAIRAKAWREAHAEEVRARGKTRYAENKEAMKAARKANYARDPEKHRKAAKNYRDTNAAHRERERVRALKRLREATPENRMLRSMRTRIYIALKGNAKVSKTATLVGCTIPELRAHLEARFQPGMTWANYGEWHVDHIKPCILFDFRDPEEQGRCFHFSNLQPLWGVENMSKGDSYTEMRSDAMACLVQ